MRAVAGQTARGGAQRADDGADRVGSGRVRPAQRVHLVAWPVRRPSCLERRPSGVTEAVDQRDPDLSGDQALAPIRGSIRPAQALRRYRWSPSTTHDCSVRESEPPPGYRTWTSSVGSRTAWISTSRRECTPLLLPAAFRTRSDAYDGSASGAGGLATDKRRAYRCSRGLDRVCAIALVSAAPSKAPRPSATASSPGTAGLPAVRRTGGVDGSGTLSGRVRSLTCAYGTRTRPVRPGRTACWAARVA